MLLRLHAVGILLGACALAGCGNATKQAEFFSVGLAQHGRDVAIRDHQAVLDKAPFAIVLTFKALDAVLVNASFSGQTFNQAGSGVPLGRLEGFSGRQIREYQFNPDKLLTASDRDFHHWHCFGPQNHKFDAVEDRQGLVVCRRTVAGYAQADGRPRDIRHLDKDAIYLVFVRTEWTADRSRRVETQREYLKLSFK